jgi:putative endonuclease
MGSPAAALFMYYTVLLQSESTGRFYLGSTDDLPRRIRQHNDPQYSGSKTTKRFAGPWKLVFSESFETRSQAMAREKQLKSWKNRKAIQHLIETQSHNAGFR